MTQRYRNEALYPCNGTGVIKRQSDPSKKKLKERRCMPMKQKTA